MKKNSVLFAMVSLFVTGSAFAYPPAPITCSSVSNSIYANQQNGFSCGGSTQYAGSGTYVTTTTCSSTSGPSVSVTYTVYQTSSSSYCTVQSNAY